MTSEAKNIFCDQSESLTPLRRVSGTIFVDGVIMEQLVLESGATSNSVILTGVQELLLLLLSLLLLLLY
jgi:hypothetical protein